MAKALELNKQELRKQMSEQRLGLTATQIEQYSASIAAKLSQLEPIVKARQIMGFAAIRNEVDLRLCLAAQQAQGKKILLPRVEESGDLAAVEFTGWLSTCPGSFGILEPTGVTSSLHDIDVVLVPGLVFDAHGYRLGYGKGYYDRFLKQLPAKTFICGVCYEFQVVDSINPHAGDVPVHWIVTEKSELVIDWNFF